MYGDFRSTNSAIAPQRSVDPGTGQHHGERRFGVDHHLPGPDLGQPIEDLVGVVAEDPDEGRIELRAAAPLGDRPGRGRSAGAVGHLDVLRQLHDPRRHGSVVAGDLTRPALAVPPLVRARQRRADLGGQIEPLGELAGQRARAGRACRRRRGVRRRRTRRRFGSGAAAIRRRRAGGPCPAPRVPIAARSRTWSPSRRCRRRTTSPARGRRSGNRRSRAARCSTRRREPRHRARSSSATRRAIRHCRRTCSIGWLKPRSMPSDSAATISASRTGGLSGVDATGSTLGRSRVGTGASSSTGGTARGWTPDAVCRAPRPPRPRRVGAAASGARFR